MTFEEACARIPSGGRLASLREFPDRWSASIYIETVTNGVSHSREWLDGFGSTPAEAIISAITMTKPKVAARDLLLELGL